MLSSNGEPKSVRRRRIRDIRSRTCITTLGAPTMRTPPLKIRLAIRVHGLAPMAACTFDGRPMTFIDHVIVRCPSGKKNDVASRPSAHFLGSPRNLTFSRSTQTQRTHKSLLLLPKMPKPGEKQSVAQIFDGRTAALF